MRVLSSTAARVKKGIGNQTFAFWIQWQPLFCDGRPSHKFVYMANIGKNSVSALSINSTTGALTVVPGSPFPTGFLTNEPIAVAVDPTGKFAIADGSGFVAGSSINPVSGALTLFAGPPFGALGFPAFSI